MSYLIRVATEEDIPSVTELYNSDTNLFGEDTTCYGADDISEYIKDKRKKMTLCVSKDQVIGAILGEYHDTYAYLETIIVHKDFQGKGIGSILIYEFEKEVKSRNITLIEAMTAVRNKRMQNMFAKEGYLVGNTFKFYSKKLI